MSIYKMIDKMIGHESEAEKLYKILNTDEYKDVLMSIPIWAKGWL